MPFARSRILTANNLPRPLSDPRSLIVVNYSGHLSPRTLRRHRRKTFHFPVPEKNFINCIRNHLARGEFFQRATCRDIFISVMFPSPLRFSAARKLISLQIKQFFINIEEILRRSARLIYERPQNVRTPRTWACLKNGEFIAFTFDFPVELPR